MFSLYSDFHQCQLTDSQYKLLAGCCQMYNFLTYITQPETQTQRERLGSLIFKYITRLLEFLLYSVIWVLLQEKRYACSCLTCNYRKLMVKNIRVTCCSGVLPLPQCMSPSNELSLMRNNTQGSSHAKARRLYLGKDWEIMIQQLSQTAFPDKIEEHVTRIWYGSFKFYLTRNAFGGIQSDLRTSRHFTSQPRLMNGI